MLPLAISSAIKAPSASSRGTSSSNSLASFLSYTFQIRTWNPDPETFRNRNMNEHGKTERHDSERKRGALKFEFETRCARPQANSLSLLLCLSSCWWCTCFCFGLCRFLARPKKRFLALLSSFWGKHFGFASNPFWLNLLLVTAFSRCHDQLWIFHPKLASFYGATRASNCKQAPSSLSSKLTKLN